MSAFKAFRVMARGCHGHAPNRAREPIVIPIAPPVRPIWPMTVMWLTIGGFFGFLAGHDYASSWEDRVMNIGPAWWTVTRPKQDPAYGLGAPCSVCRRAMDEDCYLCNR